MTTTEPIQIPTRETAIKIVDLLKHGLAYGKGEPVPGQMCVEAAVCYAMGLPHGDEPPCVAPSVRSFKIGLNDSDWSSNMARAQGLRRLAIAQLGSNQIDESLFAKELALATVRKIVPIALRATAKAEKDVPSKEALEYHAKQCEAVNDLAVARDAANAAANASDCAALGYSSYTYYTSHYAATAARLAGDVNDNAARFTAGAAKAAAKVVGVEKAILIMTKAKAADAVVESSTARTTALDNILLIMAEVGVQALILCKSPGCEWLDLVDREAA